MLPLEVACCVPTAGLAGKCTAQPAALPGTQCSDQPSCGDPRWLLVATWVSPLNAPWLGCAQLGGHANFSTFGLLLVCFCPFFTVFHVPGGPGRHSWWLRCHTTLHACGRAGQRQGGGGALPDTHFCSPCPPSPMGLSWPCGSLAETTRAAARLWQPPDHQVLRHLAAPVECWLQHHLAASSACSMNTRCAPLPSGEANCSPGLQVSWHLSAAMPGWVHNLGGECGGCHTGSSSLLGGTTVWLVQPLQLVLHEPVLSDAGMGHLASACP